MFASLTLKWLHRKATVVSFALGFPLFLGTSACNHPLEVSSSASTALATNSIALTGKLSFVSSTSLPANTAQLGALANFRIDIATLPTNATHFQIQSINGISQTLPSFPQGQPGIFALTPTVVGAAETVTATIAVLDVNETLLTTTSLTSNTFAVVAAAANTPFTCQTTTVNANPAPGGIMVDGNGAVVSGVLSSSYSVVIDCNEPATLSSAQASVPGAKFSTATASMTNANELLLTANFASTTQTVAFTLNETGTSSTTSTAAVTVSPTQLAALQCNFAAPSPSTLKVSTAGTFSVVCNRPLTGLPTITSSPGAGFTTGTVTPSSDAKTFTFPGTFSASNTWPLTFTGYEAAFPNIAAVQNPFSVTVSGTSTTSPIACQITANPTTVNLAVNADGTSTGNPSQATTFTVDVQNVNGTIKGVTGLNGFAASGISTTSTNVYAFTGTFTTPSGTTDPTVTATVVDGNGVTASCMVAVHVLKVYPALSCITTASAISAITGTNITFLAQANRAATFVTATWSGGGIAPTSGTPTGTNAFSFSGAFTQAGPSWQVAAKISDPTNPATVVTCSPVTIAVTAAVAVPPLTCVVQASVGANLSPTGEKINFVAVASRAAGFVGSSANGGGISLSAATPWTQPNTFIFSGAFGQPGSWQVGASLSDPTNNTTVACAPVMVAVGPAFTCTVTADTNVSQPADQANHPIAPSSPSGFTISTNYPALVPTIAGNGGFVASVAPFAADTTQKSFRFAGVFAAVGTVGVAATATTADGQLAVGCVGYLQSNPVYPALNEIFVGIKGHDFLYTGTEAEIGNAGYTDYGGSFYLYSQSYPSSGCSIAIYRCRTTTGNFHFLSQDPACNDQKYVSGGTAYFAQRSAEGVIGYACATQVPSTGHSLRRFQQIHFASPSWLMSVETIDPNFNSSTYNYGTLLGWVP